uniref:Uncharacterized protein n=1 Tax=Rhizophora mucronata TaxID=61149 RepID=A0A2P2LQF2_RHIMU
MMASMGLFLKTFAVAA